MKPTDRPRGIVTVGGDGSVELPADVMDELGLVPGGSVRLVIDEDGVAITREGGAVLRLGRAGARGG